jgi:hypothetical protein
VFQKNLYVRPGSCYIGSLKTYIIRTWAIASGNGYIQQAEKYAELGAVVGYLVKSQADPIDLWFRTEDDLAIAEGPHFIEFRLFGAGKRLAAGWQVRFKIVNELFGIVDRVCLYGLAAKSSSLVSRIIPIHKESSAICVVNWRMVILFGCGCQSYLSLGTIDNILRVITASFSNSF